MAHTCHAIACKREVKPEMLMCYQHWRMVPRAVQALVWKHYRPGQCDDQRPSLNYCAAAKGAVRSVAEKEGRTITGEEPELLLYDIYAPDAPTPPKHRPKEETK